MSRRGGRTPAREWIPLERRELSPAFVARMAQAYVDADGGDLGEWERVIWANHESWTNDRYQVVLRRIQPANEQTPPLVHLSIKRHDRNPVRDWRHLQQIKNELVGPECEGVEIFPAESRLVDEANQFHLYVFADPEFRLPFGYGERLLGTPEEAAAAGARQREWEPGLTTGATP